MDHRAGRGGRRRNRRCRDVRCRPRPQRGPPQATKATSNGSMRSDGVVSIAGGGREGLRACRWPSRRQRPLWRWRPPWLCTCAREATARRTTRPWRASASRRSTFRCHRRAVAQSQPARAGSRSTRSTPRREGVSVFEIPVGAAAAVASPQGASERGRLGRRRSGVEVTVRFARAAPRPSRAPGLALWRLAGARRSPPGTGPRSRSR